MLGLWPNDRTSQTRQVVSTNGSGTGRNVLTHGGVRQDNGDVRTNQQPVSSLPPAAAPPLPMTTPAPEPVVDQPSGTPVFAVGSSILLNGTGVTQGMAGEKGIVVNADGQSCDVQLDSGLRIGPLPIACLTRVPDGGNLPSLEASAGSNKCMHHWPTMRVWADSNNRLPGFGRPLTRRVVCSPLWPLGLDSFGRPSRMRRISMAWIPTSKQFWRSMDTKVT